MRGTEQGSSRGQFSSAANHSEFDTLGYTKGIAEFSTWTAVLACDIASRGLPDCRRALASISAC